MGYEAYAVTSNKQKKYWKICVQLNDWRRPSKKFLAQMVEDGRYEWNQGLSQAQIWLAQKNNSFAIILTVLRQNWPYGYILVEPAGGTSGDFCFNKNLSRAKNSKTALARTSYAPCPVSCKVLSLPSWSSSLVFLQRFLWPTTAACFYFPTKSSPHLVPYRYGYGTRIMYVAT